MRMRVDDRRDRQVFDFLVDQFEPGAGRFEGRQWIENNPAFLAANERDVREIEAAHLVDAVGDLE